MFQTAFGQNDSLNKKINLLSRVSDIPYDSCRISDKDCGDEVIWEIVKYGKAAIEPLINKISDTTYSNYYLYGYGNYVRLRTGDIAYITLTQILSFNSLSIMKGLDVDICGGYKVDLYVFYLKRYSDRVEFQKQVNENYHQRNIRWKLMNKMELTPCEIQHDIIGRYVD